MYYVFSETETVTSSRRRSDWFYPNNTVSTTSTTISIRIHGICRIRPFVILVVIAFPADVSFPNDDANGVCFRINAPVQLRIFLDDCDNDDGDGRSIMEV